MTLKPQFFLVRPGAEQITSTGQILVQPATAVPLIPADLLPEWLEVIGVPRSLSPDETKEMGNLGVFHAETKTYKLRFAPVTGDEACASDESTVRTSVTQPGTASMEPSSPSLNEPDKNKPTTSTSTSSPNSKSKLKPAQGLSSSRHNPNNQQQQQQPAQPVPVPTFPPPKEVSPAPNTTTTSSPCRHWCHHGVCRWGLACHYEHSMPTTPAGLAEVGLSRVPDWWLQARGLMPMPPEVLRAVDASSGRRSAKKMVVNVKKKQKLKSRVMKRGDVQERHHDEASEAEDEYEEDEELEDDGIRPELKRGMEEILIDLD
ncbi:hypothetical protein NW762_000493 [Fusarium torreyae]|uniref:C3H1-type domain-containing protein n=1 Tax=Fusarium torreyae TaxID=1237075 RepID=A0A9W8SJJ4_9HYPO|nr:hypothetical protein NW762_000493 [Fusarium torreyae]